MIAFTFTAVGSGIGLLNCSSERFRGYRMPKPAASHGHQGLHFHNFPHGSTHTETVTPTT